MADDSNRIGNSALMAALTQVRQVGGVGSTAASSGTGAAAGGNTSAPAAGSFGPRGNRMLPSSFPLDQLDRRAARGTYLDILV